MKTYIGIDNGVTGTIGIINNESVCMLKTPVKKEQSYTKKKQNITRLDYQKMYDILKQYNAFIVIERPMVNPGRFKATVSAIRCLEATLIIIEQLGIPYQYIDSKNWQKFFIPSGIKGAADLKTASMQMGIRLFPELKSAIEKHGDADSLLMAEHARRVNLYR